MQLPDSQEIELLHRKLIKQKSLDVDIALVEAGCLLHDLGVYTLFTKSDKKVTDYNYMNHGIRGEELLLKERLGSALARIASHHLGVGFTEEDIKKQGLPFTQPYIPETKEERLITYADKFHSKTTPPRFNTYDSFKKYAATFGPEIAERFEQLAEEFGKPDLAPLIEKYGHEVR
jgi:uncharacterized protein